jgi:hypothetical protein
MNSGDWVENLSALEMRDGQWRIFKYESSDLSQIAQPAISTDQISTPFPESLRKKIFNPGDILHIWF